MNVFLKNESVRNEANEECDVKSKREYAYFTWIVLILYFTCHDIMSMKVPCVWLI